MDRFHEWFGYRGHAVGEHLDGYENCLLHEGSVYFGDHLYSAECDESPFFLCYEDADEWCRRNDYTGWIRCDLRRYREYDAGRITKVQLYV